MRCWSWLSKFTFRSSSTFSDPTFISTTMPHLPSMHPSLPVLSTITSPLLRKPILSHNELAATSFLLPGSLHGILSMRFNCKLGQHRFTIFIHCRQLPGRWIITVPTLLSPALYSERGLKLLVGFYRPDTNFNTSYLQFPKSKN